MKTLKDNLFGILLTTLGFGITALLYPKMPSSVPVHWGMDGQADGFMPKPWGPFFLPLTIFALAVVFGVIRAISPKEAPIHRFERVYSIFTAATLAFLLVLNVVANLIATGSTVNMANVVFLAMGGLFVVLGNYMGKVTRNYFVGIRTPWTLANEEVWLRTHRLGGKVFVIAGLIVLAAVALHLSTIVLPVIVLTAIIPVAYSYVIYRQLSRVSS